MDTLVYNHINQALDEEEKHFCSILLNYAILQKEKRHYIALSDLLSLMPGYDEEQVKKLLLRIASPINYESIGKKKRYGSLVVLSWVLITQGTLHYGFSCKFEELVQEYLLETKSKLPMFISSKNPFFGPPQESPHVIPTFATL